MMPEKESFICACELFTVFPAGWVELCLPGVLIIKYSRLSLVFLCTQCKQIHRVSGVQMKTFRTNTIVYLNGTHFWETHPNIVTM